jgi:ferrochelatase
MKRALLLLNMGGPRNLDEVEVFLKNMFNDPCILSVKNPILRKILAFFITKARVKTARKNYEKIGGKSPLCEITQSLCDKISLYGKFAAVDFAMNYTPPFSKETLKKYENFGEIVLFPLYPHRSITTITSSLNEIYKAADELKFKGNFRVASPFFDSDEYADIVVSSITDKIAGADISDVTLIFSAHSLPQSIIASGDLYEADVIFQVEKLTRILKERGIKFKEINLAYQSRLGPVKWLEPSLNEALGKCENKKALIYPISFCIDNSETIFELAIEYKRVADELGFKFYDVVGCPNDGENFAKFILNRAEE